MKPITIRLSDTLYADIEAEARRRRMSKSEIARERIARSSALEHGRDAIADLIGSVNGLPSDLSASKKEYLKLTGYGRKRRR